MSQVGKARHFTEKRVRQFCFVNLVWPQPMETEMSLSGDPLGSSEVLGGAGF